jgi:1,2-dihydroxy-3-keto-5-methylthiopentene dioxygenase
MFPLKPITRRNTLPIPGGLVKDKKVKMKAYYYDNLPGDQREPHDSGRAVPASYLSSLGVLYRHCPSVSAVDVLAAERAYKNRDEITVSPDKMGAVYEDKVKMFFNEHLHEDEEIRYILDGHGYFDVRSEGDEWVRIRLEKDDLLVLPAGIYHRFTTDEGNVSFCLGCLAAGGLSPLLGVRRVEESKLTVF